MTSTIPEAEQGKPGAREKLVANIRALADLIEQHTELPVPQGARAQFSLLDHVGTVDERLTEVRRLAALAGAEIVEHDDGGLSFDVYLGGGPCDIGTAQYIVHTAGAAAKPIEPTAPRCAWLGGCSETVDQPNEICGGHEGPAQAAGAR